jgi:hypothetical protein
LRQGREHRRRRGFKGMCRHESFINAKNGAGEWNNAL